MKILIALVFAASLCRTLALPNGAPPQACANLTPGHGGEARPNPSSSSIDLDSFQVAMSSNLTFDYLYVPGATYMVRLVSTGTFRGFLINVQTMDGEVVGEFQVNNATDVRLSDCGDSDPATYPDEQAITHTSNDDKNMVEFYWTAPPTDEGPLQFHFTTVRVFDIYWVDEVSDTIFGPSGPPDPTEPTDGSKSMQAFSLWTTLAVALTIAVKQMF